MISTAQPCDHVNAPNPEERSWRVFGRIAGQYLPSTPVRIADFAVGPLPENVHVFERVKNLKAVPAFKTHYTVTGADIEVTSQCYFWIDKMAPSSKLAIETVFSKDIPLLQTALSLRNETPYQIEIIFAKDGNTTESHGSVEVKALFWHVEPLTSERLDIIDNDYQIIKKHDTTRSAAHILVNAIRQDAMASTNDTAAREAVLLNYFKVIEWIAGRVGTQIPRDREKRQQEILSCLQRILDSNKALTKKISAIHTTTTSLSRLEGSYLSLKVDAAANKLKMSDGWKRAATELGKLRNTRLGHPHSSTQGDEQALVKWRGIEKETGYSASRLAREILMAYVDRFRRDPH